LGYTRKMRGWSTLSWIARKKVKIMDSVFWQLSSKAYLRSRTVFVLMFKGRNEIYRLLTASFTL
jgi:hypothetical protein